VSGDDCICYGLSSCGCYNCHPIPVLNIDQLFADGWIDLQHHDPFLRPLVPVNAPEARPLLGFTSQSPLVFNEILKYNQES